MITVRKLKLSIMADEELRIQQLKWIKDEQYNQYRALNNGMAFLIADHMLNTAESTKIIYKNNEINKKKKKIYYMEDKIKKENNKLEEEKILKFESDINKLKHEIKILENEKVELELETKNLSEQFKNHYVEDMYTRLDEIPFQYKDNKSLVQNRLKKDFDFYLNNGGKRGERKPTAYKRDYPLLIRGRLLNFYYNKDNVFIKWIAGITFKVELGNKIKNNIELRHTLHQCMNNEKYKVCDSSLQFDNKNNIILNLTIDIPINTSENNFIEGRVMGVDLGMKIPAYASFNDVEYCRAFGDIEDFLRVRTQLQSRMRKLQMALTLIKGGHGRGKKLQALNRLKDKEKDFVNTYNHMISKRIIEYSIKNCCGVINLEYLSLAAREKDLFLTLQPQKSNRIKRNWSYYDLQTKIENKAKKYGIIVKKIDPYLTSQTCHICGNYDEGQRISQEQFECKACNRKFNADYNASKNIALSTKYINNINESEFFKRYKNN
ncbi:RNA-guided endonuclease TnpB family protein [Clostridium fallax]|uniref:Transposase, IS605 OrfB family, central region n=1 Tax=Clostridium fallax TaxID=1533 RepID=A0A1M4V136_9CLOT|nr:RNA-guided endonuclease TnpB family protein [Clostridium fallax]SHE62620.1 transposase, IS605 OrfB family, central region [Clostridium fallax]SQB06601.1 transposase, IS605 OrfB family, central region [Clostridium fallax]